MPKSHVLNQKKDYYYLDDYDNYFDNYYWLMSLKMNGWNEKVFLLEIKVVVQIHYRIPSEYKR